MNKDNIANKHHYVPKFYLKAWINPNNKLVQWSAVSPQCKIMRESKSPSATAFEYQLYTLHDSDKTKDHIEKKILSCEVENKAALIFKKINRLGIKHINDQEKETFLKFIVTMPYRHPDRVKAINSSAPKILENIALQFKEKAATEIHTEIDQYVDKAKPNLGLETLGSICSSQNDKINNPHGLKQLEENIFALNQHAWTIKTIRDSKFSFLTSDVPIKYDYLQREFASFSEFLRFSTLYLPMSPQTCLMLSPQDTQIAEDQKTEKIFLKYINKRQVSDTSAKYIYSVDDKQDAFVRKYLNKHANL